jgi:hypothetical protein
MIVNWVSRIFVPVNRLSFIFNYNPVDFINNPAKLRRNPADWAHNPANPYMKDKKMIQLMVIFF